MDSDIIDIPTCGEGSWWGINGDRTVVPAIKFTLSMVSPLPVGPDL